MPDVIDAFVVHSIKELIRYGGEPEIAPELTVTEDAKASIALQLQGGQDACVLDLGELRGADAVAPIIQACAAQLRRPYQAAAVVGAKDCLGHGDFSTVPTLQAASGDQAGATDASWFVTQDSDYWSTHLLCIWPYANQH